MHSPKQCLKFVLCIILCFVSLVSCAYSSSPESAIILPPEDGWVLFVNKEGPNYLGSTWWQAIGVDPAGLGYDNVQLKKGDVDIPFIWIADGDASGLLFNAEISTMRIGSWALIPWS